MLEVVIYSEIEKDRILEGLVNPYAANVENRVSS